VAGAVEIVTTDVAEFPLQKAQDVCADRTLNVAEDSDGFAGYMHEKGHFDVHFECSGASAALSAAIPALRPKAVIAQLGLGGDMTLSVHAMTAKELTLKESFRFHQE